MLPFLCLARPIAAADVVELSDMSLEQLMSLEVEVETASKYRQKSSDIATSLTVVGKDQIKQFGHRTLGDVLRSVRGFFVSSDRMYENVGIRGFDQSGDYNGRMLVMVDGNRINDAIYDQGFTGTEFPVDVDLIERVEVLRGPGSSIYGNNAFFAVINIITRSGADYRGGELAGSYGSFDTYKGRFSYGRKLGSGLEFLLSGTDLNSAGPTLRYPEFDDASGPGRTSGTNDEHGKQFFAKASYGGFSVEGGYGRRYKGLPGGAFGTNFDDPANSYQDSEAFVNAQYQAALTPKLDFTGRFFYGDNDYKGVYRYGEVTNLDLAHSWWTGLELRLVSRQIDRHTVVGGLEIQENWLQAQRNFDLSPAATYLDDKRDSQRIGVYLQDDYHLWDELSVSLGGRFDNNSLISASQFSPRLGVNYRPFGDTVIKAQYSQAFRAPNVSHLYYGFPPVYDEFGGLSTTGRLASPNLKAEQIETWELSWEQTIARAWQVTASAYYLHMHDLFRKRTVDANYFQVVNHEAERGYGGELELRRQWSNGAMVRGSYGLYFAETESGQAIANAPRHLLQLNAMAPLFSDQWHGGAELQMVSRRESASAGVPAYTRVNLSLSYQPLRNLDLSATVYDLFGDLRRELSPDDLFGDSLGAITVPQDGRTFRVKLVYRF